MTVEKIDGANAFVQWFNGGVYNSVAFPVASLTEVDPTPGLQHTAEKERARLKATD